MKLGHKLLAIPVTTGIGLLIAFHIDDFTHHDEKIRLCDAYAQAIREDLEQNAMLSLPSVDASGNQTEVQIVTTLSKEEAPHWIRTPNNSTCAPVTVPYHQKPS